MRLRLLLLPVLAAACGPGEPPRSVTIIDPVAPTGSLAGLVVDAVTGGPIEGAKATVLNVAGKTAESNGAGAWLISLVPASTSLAVTITKDGFIPAYDEVDIPSSAGNLAQNNGVGFSGPIGLFPVDDAGKLALRAVGPGGVAIAGATATVHLDAAFTREGVAAGSAGGVVGDDGLIRGLPDLFAVAAVLPDALLTAVVAPPAGSALLPRAATTTVREAIAAGAFVVELTAAGGGAPDLGILSSNVADLVDTEAIVPSTLAVSEPVRFTFNEPVDPTTLFVRVVREDGTDVPVAAPTTADDLSFDVVVAGGAMPPGAEMNVRVEVVAVGGSALFQRDGTFFTTPTDPALAIASARLVEKTSRALTCPAGADATIEITMNQPVGARDDDGEPVDVPGELLPVRATSTAAIFADTALAGTDGGVALADFFDLPSGQPSSGFTTRFDVAWPATVVSGASTGSVTAGLALEFNDVEAAADTGRGPTALRLTNGVPAGVVPETNVTISTSSPCP